MEKIDMWLAELEQYEQKDDQFYSGIQDGYHFLGNLLPKLHEAWAITLEGVRAVADTYYKERVSEPRILGFCGGYFTNLRKVVQRWTITNS